MHLKRIEGILKLTLGASRTYIAFDTKDAAALVKAMKAIGVNVGTCGTRTVRLRPMLIFDETHSTLAS